MNVFDTAKQLLQRGYSVIPIAYGKKTPIIRWVQEGFADNRPAYIDLQKWFAGQQVNLAIVTGAVSGLLVVDIDKPELFDSFQRQYPTGLIAQTPKGGYHLYYRYEGTDIGNSVSRLASGIDVRCRHGYVLAPPSFVKYDTGLEGSYSWLRDDDPAPLPEALRQTILAELKAASPDIQVTDREDGHELWVRVLSSGFSSGRHNNEVKDCARYLFRQGLSLDAIINTLSAVNSKDPTPLPQKELEDTIRSGVGYEQNRKGNKAEPDKPKLDFDATPLIDVAAQYDDYFQQWLITDWLPENAFLMVSAPPENYKTWLLLDAAISVALGKEAAPFLGQYPIPNEPLPVYIVQQEDYMGQLMTRVRAIEKAKAAGIGYPIREWDHGNGHKVFSFGMSWFAPIYVHTNAQLAFDDDESMDALEEQIAKNKIRLVVIDPLYMLGNAEDFFAGVARKMGRVKELRAKYDTAFVIAHHNRKSGGDGREQIFGSQLLNGAIEGVWLIQEKGKDQNGQPIRIIDRKGKSFPGQQQTMRLSFNISTEDVYQSPSVSIPYERDEHGLWIPAKTDEGKPVVKAGDDVEIEAAVSRMETYVPYSATVTPYNENENLPEGANGKFDTDILALLKEHPGQGIRAIQRGIGLEDKLYTSVNNAVKRLTTAGILQEINRKYFIPSELPEGL